MLNLYLHYADMINDYINVVSLLHGHIAKKQNFITRYSVFIREGGDGILDVYYFKSTIVITIKAKFSFRKRLLGAYDIIMYLNGLEASKKFVKSWTSWSYIF